MGSRRWYKLSENITNDNECLTKRQLALPFFFPFLFLGQAFDGKIYLYPPFKLRFVWKWFCFLFDVNKIRKEKYWVRNEAISFLSGRKEKKKEETVSFFPKDEKGWIRNLMEKQSRLPWYLSEATKESGYQRKRGNSPRLYWIYHMHLPFQSIGSRL